MTKASKSESLHTFCIWLWKKLNTICYYMAKISLCDDTMFWTVYLPQYSQQVIKHTHFIICYCVCCVVRSVCDDFDQILSSQTLEYIV